jgi:hypothetical protein
VPLFQHGDSRKQEHGADTGSNTIVPISARMEAHLIHLDVLRANRTCPVRAIIGSDLWRHFRDVAFTKITSACRTIQELSGQAEQEVPDS